MKLGLSFGKRHKVFLGLMVETVKKRKPHPKKVK